MLKNHKKTNNGRISRVQRYKIKWNNETSNCKPFLKTLTNLEENSVIKTIRGIKKTLKPSSRFVVLFG